MATCPWSLDLDACCEDHGMDVNDPADLALVTSVVARVSAMLSRWSGYRYGGCATVRPLDPCGECRSGCCASGDCITLHSAGAVTEVRILGEVVDSSQYHFDAASGSLCAVPPMRWPSRDPRFESVGTLEVDVRTGEEPDEWALAVAAELACEILASCRGSKNCRLPKNVTQVSSQGVVISISEDELLYALPSVVTWVRAVNPHMATRPARVFSPELRSSRPSMGLHRPWR